MPKNSERPSRAGSAEPSAKIGRADSAEPSVKLAEPPSHKIAYHFVKNDDILLFETYDFSNWKLVH